MTEAASSLSSIPLIDNDCSISHKFRTFVLNCVQTEWIAAIERHRDRTATPLATGGLGFARAKARLARAKLTYQMRVESAGKDAAASNAASSNAVPTSAASTHEALVRQRERATSEQAGRVTSTLGRDEFDAMRFVLIRTFRQSTEEE